MLKEGDLIMIVKCLCTQCKDLGRQCRWADQWIGVVGRLRNISSPNRPEDWCVTHRNGAIAFVSAGELLLLKAGDDYE